MEAVCKSCGAVYNLEGTHVPESMACLCKSKEFKIAETPIMVIAQ